MPQKVKKEIVLRDYQVEVVDSCMDYLKGPNKKPVIVVAPTAAGKALMISKVAHLWGKPCLVLQPSGELLAQNHGKLIDFGGDAEIFSASLSLKNIGELTYATLGSIKSMARAFKLQGVDTVLIDECHTKIPPEPTSMFMKFINELKPSKVIGFTATPFMLVSSMEGSKLEMLTRMDPGYFEDFIHIVQVSEIVSKGFWAPLKYEIHEFDESGLELNTTGNEFTEDSVREAIRVQGINNNIYLRIKELQKEGKRGILVFMDSLETARKMVQHIPRSAYLGSDTPAKERDQIIRDYKSGKLQVICNYNILSVGFDYPELDVVILGSPTNSLALLYQRIGRVTRIHLGKPFSLIIDYCNNTKRFGKMETLTIENLEGFGMGVFNNDILLTNTLLGGVRKTKQEVLDSIKGKVSKGDKIWFGIHNGKLIKDLPVHYMKFILSKLDFNSPPMARLKREMLKVLEEHDSRFVI
jgi:DNA repair protein RadD